MDFSDYQQATAIKSRVFNDPDEEIEYWIKGLLEAANNLADITTRHKKPFGTRPLCAEAGDILFRLSRIIDFYGLSAQEIAEESL